jgi:hypothetical protein
LIKKGALLIQGNEIKYQLSFLESLMALAKSPTANLDNLVEIKGFENPWSSQVLRGVRAPGTGFPFLILIGTMRYRRGRDFTVIYKREPVWVLEFKNEKYQRWIFTAEGNEAVVERLRKGEISWGRSR